jgi:aldose 1-epimerase
MTTVRFGTMPDGRDVMAHTLRAEPGVELTVLDLGATVQRLRAPTRDRQLLDVVLGYSDVASYLSPTNPYFGATVGRYANRIADGRFTLDGKTYPLTTNEADTCLHGGTEGFHLRLWTVVDQAPDSLTLELVSPDGDQGFPGELTARAEYRVAGHTVTIELSATCDAPTVVSLTNHAYFNLGGPGSGSVEEHLLTVDADTYLPVDRRAIPLGSLDPVAGTPFDFTAPAAIGHRVRHNHPQVLRVAGIDHAFQLRGEGMRRAARLEHPDSGRFLEISTDQPSLHVYIGNRLDGTLTGRDGRLLRQSEGIALETQRHPDAPNQPAFPSPVLNPGETYRSTTTWRLGTA